MSQKELNLGILAHVDAGKTTLTERLLYEAGVIRDFGSVDAGTTQTDTLALERQRGITIKSAVTSFAIGDVHVNLIDTPGHPDFIAEVERVLSVLDGAVLVVSAVEGVQPQTRILMRALKRLRVPTLLFVNKIDRAGADAERVLARDQRAADARDRSDGNCTRPRDAKGELRAFDAGTSDRRSARGARRRMLAAYVSGTTDVSHAGSRRAREQTKHALVHPVFFGAAITGAGVEPLMSAIAELLPSSSAPTATANSRRRLQDRTRRGRREGRVRPGVLRDSERARSRAFRSRRRRKGDGARGRSSRTGGAAAVGFGGSDRAGVGAARRPDR